MKNEKLSVYDVGFNSWYWSLPVIYIDIKDLDEHWNEITDQAYIENVRIIPVVDLLSSDLEVSNDNNRTPF